LTKVEADLKAAETDVVAHVEHAGNEIKTLQQALSKATPVQTNPHPTDTWLVISD
jgi:hypothetical protein